MDRWDVLIIAAAAYVAIMSLVKLMAARRNELIDHVRKQLDQQRGHQRPQSKATEESEAEPSKDRGAA